MTNRFVRAVIKLPRFQQLTRVEVDSLPSDEASMQSILRVFARVDGVETRLQPADWGFTYSDVMSQDAAIRADAMAQLRKDRDALLVDSDKITMMCYSRGIPVPDDWKTYQQALRDLPATSTPDFDGGGNLIGVNWPNKPTTKP